MANICARYIILGSLILFFTGGFAFAAQEIPNDWHSRVQNDIAEREYHLTWQEQSKLQGVNAAWQAPNRAHDLRTYFTGNGPRMVRRTESEPTWIWGLELLNQPAVEQTKTNGNRIELHRAGGLVEWYVNDPNGLEQGFTIPKSANPNSNTEIILDIAVRGSLNPGLMPGGKTVEFLSKSGVGLIHYGELKAWDARGNTLPAHMELISKSNNPIIRLIVDASNGVYPITIDPLATSAAWTAEVNQADALFGTSVATAGDVNGDGCSDVIIGAHLYDSGQDDEGKVFVYHGSASGLSDSPDWTAECDQAGAQFGFCVATAGDVNGDGCSDVIVGAPYFESRGGTFIYYGSTSGLTSAGIEFEGNHYSSRFGYSVATAGDINGDGYSDIIIGSPRYNNGQQYEGAAFLYVGSATSMANTPAWTVESNQAGSYLGCSVSSAGDVNGDGYSDVIAGAISYSSGETNEGRAFLYHGSASGLPATADWYAEQNQSYAYFGNSVATAGDINGDGYADVIIGAYKYVGGQSNEGRAYVYCGSVAGLSATPEWTVESDHANAQLGYCVATAGDVNGDGYADVIVGAYQYPDDATSDGWAFLYYGSSVGLSTSADWTADGQQIDAQFGFSVATAGDVNGDGFSDVIIGAPNYDNGETDEGRAFVYYGSASSLSETPVWDTEGNQTNAYYGWSVATAGDVNADGFSDVIIGAPNYDNGETDEGRAYVYHGSVTGLPDSPDWIAESNEAGAQFGYSVATAGDVNGDGYSDVIIGAPYYNQADEGAAFVYHGSSSGLSATAEWIAEMEGSDYYFGWSVAGAGDVNGDGYADVIIGRVTEEYSGCTVYLGSPSGLPVGRFPYSWYIDSIGGEHVSVSTAGDVNGDGYSDILIGIPHYGYGTSQANEGCALLYYGSSSGISSQDSWRVESKRGGSQFGYSVATAGDVNGDGYSDIIIGSPRYNNGQQYEGMAFLYPGSASGPAKTHTWAVESNQAGAQMGWSVSSAGDVNGDGYSDVIVGAIAYASGETNEGRAFVYHGSDSGLSTTVDWIGEGDQGFSYYGNSVAAAGDVNGDGYSDVIIGAYKYVGGQSDEGFAFLYYGNGETGGGVPMLPIQFKTALPDFVSPMGMSDSVSEIAAAMVVSKGPFGRGQVKLEVECKPLGTLFDGAGTILSWDWVSTNESLTGNPLTELLNPLEDLTHNTVYHWRTRVLYHPATSPYLQHSRWFTPCWNGSEEGDFRTMAIPFPYWMAVLELACYWNETGHQGWCDINGDGAVDESDMLELRRAWYKAKQ
jgi:FG-GAP repeat/FG-GAP-like repeat